MQHHLTNTIRIGSLSVVSHLVGEGLSSLLRRILTPNIPAKGPKQSNQMLVIQPGTKWTVSRLTAQKMHVYGTPGTKQIRPSTSCCCQLNVSPRNATGARSEVFERSFCLCLYSSIIPIASSSSLVRIMALRPKVNAMPGYQCFSSISGNISTNKSTPLSWGEKPHSNTRMRWDRSLLIGSDL